MNKPISRRRFVTQLGALGAISTVSIALPHESTASTVPDHSHIKANGRGWKLRPSGSDDYANLDWVLRNTPRGETVKLARGIFKLGRPVMVPDFDGTLRGVGPRQTTITCTDVYSYEIWEAPGGGKDLGEPKPPPFPRVPVDGSSTLTAPMLIGFYKTPLQPGQNPSDRANRIEIKNLRCRGAMLGTPWMFGDEVLCINIINSFDWHSPDSVLETTRQDVVISNVEVDGYSTPAFGPFENACACITVLGGAVATSDYNLTGDDDGDAFGFANGGLIDVIPAQGNVTVTDCVYRNCRFGPGIVGYRDGKVRFENNRTDGCRANCLQIIDVGNSNITIRENKLNCDSFLLPPELVGGAVDVPSSLGCVVAIQGMGSALGYPANVQWLRLASDPLAHEGRPETGPVGTWRPRGSVNAPALSKMKIVDNHCQSSVSPNTYCYHIADLSNLAFAMPSLDLAVVDNRCEGSQTCIGLEHVNDGRVARNECSSQAFGIELHDAVNSHVTGNSFDFGLGVEGCEVRSLARGQKIDFSRVVPDAGFCTVQT